MRTVWKICTNQFLTQISFIMKKIASLLLLFVFAISLTACSEDNDDSAKESTSSDLVGTWDMTKNESDNIQIKVGSKNQSSFIAQQYFSENLDYQVVFNANGTVTSGGSFDQVTTAQINGEVDRASTLSISNGADGQGFFAGNYDENDGYLIIVDLQNNQTQEAKIISLNKNKMVLEFDLSQPTKLYTLVSNLPQTNPNVQVTGTAFLELQKRE